MVRLRLGIKETRGNIFRRETGKNMVFAGPGKNYRSVTIKVYTCTVVVRVQYTMPWYLHELCVYVRVRVRETSDRERETGLASYLRRQLETGNDPELSRENKVESGSADRASLTDLAEQWQVK